MLKLISNFLFLFVLLLLSINKNFFYKNINNTNNKNEVYFKIIIDKINLEKEVYKYKSSKNDVNKGIYLVNDYDFNSFKGAIILASHSGSSSISYFNKLHNLKIDDKVIINYQNYKYIYIIKKEYKINKTGKFKYKNNDRSIYLITCDKKNKKKQIVYYGELKKSIFVKKVDFFKIKKGN